MVPGALFQARTHAQHARYSRYPTLTNTFSALKHTRTVSLTPKVETAVKIELRLKNCPSLEAQKRKATDFSGAPPVSEGFKILFYFFTCCHCSA